MKKMTFRQLLQEIHLWLALILFLPLVMLYTSWVYRVLRGKVSAQGIERDHHSY